MNIVTQVTPVPVHPATPSYSYATPANQCEYAGHAFDSLTVSQLQWAIVSLPVWWDSHDEYYAALAAWEGRATELAARGLDYYAAVAAWSGLRGRIASVVVGSGRYRGDKYLSPLNT